LRFKSGKEILVKKVLKVALKIVEFELHLIVPPFNFIIFKEAFSLYVSPVLRWRINKILINFLNNLIFRPLIIDVIIIPRIIIF
jgi:hypothetical protein